MNLQFFHLFRSGSNSFIVKCSFLNNFSSFASMAFIHSKIVAHEYTGFSVKVIPALSDNFMYLLIDNASKTAAIVDPVDPSSVLNEAKQDNVDLKVVLTTHHHWDHAGGNSELIGYRKNSGIEVYGGDDRIPSLTTLVTNNMEFTLGQLRIRGIHTPGHTTSHICYHVTAPESSDDSGVVFTGDTLFIGGCGRFFEGTPFDMNQSLNEKLASLPDNTKVYCGHEYTVANLKFAFSVENDNEYIKSSLENFISMRKNKEPTVPSTIGQEKLFNPFMRVHLQSVQKYANATDAVSTMQILREKKNVFKG